METSVTLQRAIELACLETMGRRTETVQLEDAAGRILAAHLTSKVDDPRFDNSAMDGYAVISSDLIGASESTPVSYTHLTLPTILLV